MTGAGVFMAKIFIYCSYSGNGDAVAAKMKENGYEIRKIEPDFPLSEKLLPRMLKGGFSAFIGQTPPLVGYDRDVSGFDEVAVGSPIWNGRTASPVNTVLRDTDLSGKRLSFVLYSGSGYAKKADGKLRKLYPGAVIIHLKQPADDPGELSKLGRLFPDDGGKEQA